MIELDLLLYLFFFILFKKFIDKIDLFYTIRRSNREDIQISKFLSRVLQNSKIPYDFILY
jgi:hypothetical protein